MKEVREAALKTKGGKANVVINLIEEGYVTAEFLLGLLIHHPIN